MLDAIKQFVAQRIVRAESGSQRVVAAGSGTGLFVAGAPRCHPARAVMSPKLDVVILAAALFGIPQACAQDTPQVVGCYLAEPALTYSAAGNLERGDSSWSHAELLANGKARRPLLRAHSDHGSEWRIEGDTLHVTFSDGLVGWRLQLTGAPQGWAGRATYLTDVVVVGGGWSPPQHRITLTRRSCGRSDLRPPK